VLEYPSRRLRETISGILAGRREGIIEILVKSMTKPTVCLTILAAAMLMFCPAGCRRSRPNVDATIEEGTPQQLEQTMVQANDPAASKQLIKGFHEVEQGRYRWTMGQFSVTLRPPLRASERGAKLILQLGIPEPVIKKLGSMKLSASVDGVALPGETYTKAGDYVYSQSVAAQAFAKRLVTVNFTLDKYLPPGDADRRELGVVVTAVGFQAQ
jgi:hypothetical protein